MLVSGTGSPLLANIIVFPNKLQVQIDQKQHTMNEQLELKISKSYY